MAQSSGAGDWSDTSGLLRGRDRELGELRRLLSAAPRCAVVVGAPGEGKTTLLSVVGDLARREGRTVITTAGRVADQSLPFAALSELLVNAPAAGTKAGRQLRDRLLAHVRGEGAAAAATPLGLRLDVLAWFEELARDRPLLVAVDDAQWLDPTTRQILAFLAHRLASLPVALLFACRSNRSLDELDSLPGVVLRPLSDEDGRQVLRDARATLPAAAVRGVLRRAAGNPLALVELARVAPESVAEESDDLDVPIRIEQAFAADLPSLPPLTRTALLLAAAGAEDLDVLARCMRTRSGRRRPRTGGGGRAGQRAREACLLPPPPRAAGGLRRRHGGRTGPCPPRARGRLPQRGRPARLAPGRLRRGP